MTKIQFEKIKIFPEKFLDKCNQEKPETLIDFY